MQNQVSLFTTVTWVKGKVVSKAVMSDCMQHTKTAVVVFLDEILQNIPIDIGEIRIWTAGPASFSCHGSNEDAVRKICNSTILEF